MKHSISKSNRQTVVAAAAASLIMLACGAGYRALAARLTRSATAPSLAPGTLEQLPLRIGEWVGQDVPLDEAVVAATDTDAHLSRRYSRHNGLEAVWFYLAYGVNARDLMPHRPEVCYTGNGWTLMDRATVQLPLSNGAKLPCNAFQFSRGALNNNKVVVLDYYIVDGQYCSDVSLLRSKAWRGSGAVGYVAQVQIVAAVSGGVTVETASRAARSFAAESAPLIFALLEKAIADQRSDEERIDSDKLPGEIGK